MKITYNIKFKVTPKVTALLQDVENALVDTTFGRVFSRLYSRGLNVDHYTSFISGQDICTAVKELITDGKPLILTNDTYGRIPFETEEGIVAAYLPPNGDSTVYADVVVNEHAGNKLTLEVDDKQIFAIKWPFSTSPLFYSTDKARNIDDKSCFSKSVDAYILSNTEALVRFFILMIGTALFKTMYPELKAPGEPMEQKILADAASGDDAATGCIPNHLLHGHDDDPVIHPPMPRKAADAEKSDTGPFDDLHQDKPKDDDPLGAPTYVNPMAGVTVAKPDDCAGGTPPSEQHAQSKSNCTVDAAHVYRTAALALSKLDLTSIIKAQRVIFPESTYWKEITRAKLYEELMAELMMNCDCEVIARANGSISELPRPFGNDREKRPFLIHSFVQTEPVACGRHHYTYAIAYSPISSTTEREV